MIKLEGKIHIDLTVENGKVKTDIRSQRPVLASRVFEQKTIEQALHLVPMLFSLCGQAQSVAAVRAIESAVNTPASPAVENQRELLIQLESLREHLWRMSIEWPTLLGTPPATSVFAPINQKLAQLQQFLNKEGVLHQQVGKQQICIDDSSGQWKTLRDEIDAEYFSSSTNQNSFLADLLQQIKKQALSNLGSIQLDALPVRDNEVYVDVLRNDAADSFIAQPNWGKRCFETGPFARQQTNNTDHQRGNGLYARFIARVIEVEQLMEQLDYGFSGDVKSSFLSASSGIAQVEAVRGRLVHSVELNGDIISRYRILAPTEWNFHPRGIAAQMLSTLSAGSVAALEKHARLIIHTVDPCVGYELNIGGDI